MRLCLLALSLVSALAAPASARSHAAARSHAPAPRPPQSVPSLSRLASQYVHEEEQLGAEPTAQAKALLAHWEVLHRVRLGLRGLERKGALRHLGEARRVRLRHQLAQILGGGALVDIEGSSLSSAQMRAAKSAHGADLAVLAAIGRRVFDLDAHLEARE